MTRPRYGVAFGLLVALAAGASAQPAPTGVTYHSAAAMRAAADSLAAARRLGRVLGDRGAYTYILIQRDSSGVPEVHDHWADVLLVQAGSGTVVHGGRVTGGRDTGGGEWRGGTIAGGARQRVGAGDMLVVPAGTPHQVELARGERITYLALKVRTAGADSLHLERLYLGRNIGDSAVVSDSAWRAFLAEVVTPAFPDGLTWWEASGQWRASDDVLHRERTFVLELLHTPTPAIERRVVHVIEEYKRRFAQQAVLRTMSEVRASF